MKTTRMPTHQASACPIVAISGWLSSSPRTALTISETGWCSAKTRSQSGIVFVGTKADDAKTSGARTGNAAAWADSGSRTQSPTVAKTHENV